MVGSLLFTGLITLATSLGGLYNNSHDIIRDNCFGSSDIDHFVSGNIGSTQNAITPPSLYHYAIKFAPGIGAHSGKQLLSFYNGSVFEALPFSVDDSYYTTSHEIELEDDGVLDDYSDDDDFFNSFELLLGSPNLLYSNPILYTTDASPEFGGVGSADSVPIRFTFNNNFGKYSYRLHVDFSSNTDESPFVAYYIVKDGIYTDNYYSRTLIPPINSLLSFSVDPGVEFELVSNPDISESSYINAIYIERVITDSDVGFMGDGFDVGFEDGHTAGYHEGLDDSNQPWTIMNGISVILGAFLNSFLIVLSIEVFGIQLSYILGILVLLVGGIWILKLVRG